MTILRDQNTSRGDFIFYADRLSTLVVEKALNFIPYQAKEVRTPVGIQYGGMEATEKVRRTDIILPPALFSRTLRPSRTTLTHTGSRRHIHPSFGRTVLARPPPRHPGRAHRLDAHPVRPAYGRAALVADGPAA